MVMDAILRKDTVSSFKWLEFDGMPDETTRNALKAAGWRWGYGRKQYYTNKRYYEIPACVNAIDGGTCEYAADRAERLQTAAQSTVQASNTLYESADNITGRNAAKKREAQIDKSVDLLEKARDLEWAAKGSASHQAHKMQPGTVARRIERLRADRVKIVNQTTSQIAWDTYPYKARIDPETKKLPPDVLDELKAKIAAIKAEAQPRIDRIDQEIAENTAILTELGGLPFEGLNLRPGDTIQCRAGIGVVLKVNKKTVKVDMRRSGGAAWHLNMDITMIKTVLARAGQDIPLVVPTVTPLYQPSALEVERQEREKQVKQLHAINELEGRVIDCKGNGYFPTPSAIVSQMIDQANIAPGMVVLEPSAGKGNIADGIMRAFPGIILDLCEINSTLRDILKLKGYCLDGSDFLAYQPVCRYDRIIMNPPFEHGADMAHVRHAYDLLMKGGRIVAITSTAWQFHSEAKYQAFRDWLETVNYDVESLPDGTFKMSDRPTGVQTMMLTIDK